MGIPIGAIGVAAAKALGGIGRGRIAARKIAAEEADQEEQRASRNRAAQAEALRLSLALRSLARQDSDDQRDSAQGAAVRDYLQQHGAGDLTGMAPGTAMTEYARRNPPPSRTSPSEGRTAAEHAHTQQLLAAKGDLEGLIARTSATRSPAGTHANPRGPDAMFQFLKERYPHLADADLWGIIGPRVNPKGVPKAPHSAAGLDTYLP